MKKLSLAVAAALMFTTGASFAASLSINPATATALPGAGNPTNPTTIAVQWDNSGLAAGEGDSIDAQVFYDSTKLSASVTGDCATGAAGEIIIAAVNIQSNTIPSGAICTMTFTTTAGAADGDSIVVDLANTTVGNNGAPMAQQPAATDGAINIVATPPDPTNIGFAPTTVNLANGGNIAGTASAPTLVNVTTIAGSGVDPGSYSCTVPAGFQLTNAAAAGIPAGSDPADISVTCTLGGAPFSANSVCTRNAGGDTDVTLTLNCPAGAGPVLTSTPATGTPLTCNGAPGSTATTSVTISNATGTAQMQGISCALGGTPGFSIQTAPAATVAAGGTTSVTVACTVPADGAPAITDTLTCTTTAPAGGTLTFPVSSVAQTAVVPSQPETIPATSLWAKVGLIGLLAAVGVLLVGFRRHS